MRRPVLAGNWKMYKTAGEAAKLAREIRQGVADALRDRDVVLAPPFTSIPAVAEALRGSAIGLAGQNMHPEIEGAFTGEVSPVMLKDLGCSHVILGHSERRQIFGETDESNPFVSEEQMMPFVPFVRVRDVDEAIAKAKHYEHGYRHTSMIHSNNVRNMTRMGRALDTTLFVKNGPCMAGLGLGGEGYLSYSIATPTGEGVTNPRTFCRVRRCVMVDNLRIY
jgi:aldehyde dehydrogenase